MRSVVVIVFSRTQSVKIRMRKRALACLVLVCVYDETTAPVSLKNNKSKDARRELVARREHVIINSLKVCSKADARRN